MLGLNLIHVSKRGHCMLVVLLCKTSQLYPVLRSEGTSVAFVLQLTGHAFDIVEVDSIMS